MCGALALQCNEVTQRLPETYLRDPPRILRDEEYGHLHDAQLALLRNINKALVEVSWCGVCWCILIPC